MSERRRVVLGLAEIDRASRLLAEYIGPLAGVLAKKASKEAASLQEFYRLLAKHVKSGSERSRFLRDAGVNES
jgi:serine/threonine-protein kinase